MRKIYAFLIIMFVWTPFIWNWIKPRSGTIDNRSLWFHRHAVKWLNIARVGKDAFYLYKVFGLMIRDPHSHPMRSHYRFSENHLFVINKGETHD